MVIWHIETDFIALAIYAVLFIKAVVLNRQKDYTDKIFSLALILGIISTGIDIYSSEMMNERMGWWAYEISMLIYGLSVPLLALLWFLYTVSLIHYENEKTVRGYIIAFSVLYVAYAAVIVTNPLHELYFHLTPDMVYSRGVLFIPLIVWSQTLLGMIGILLVLIRRRQFQSNTIAFLLLLLHFITAAVYYVQIAHPGWLIVCSAYAVAFLVCDATFESQRRDALYRAVKLSLDQLQEEKEKELAYQEQLEKAVQEANYANRAKSEFLSAMSHDIRTPINGIRGMLSIIRKERHNEKRVDDCLNKIEFASAHLLSLINDVLDMSKLESGKVILAHEPFDIREVFSDCFTILSQTAADSGITLTGGKAEKEPDHPWLIGSPLHLRQIILNIAGNAIKYNKPGGRVDCIFEEIRVSGDLAVYRLVFADTGIGIDPDFLPHLFQPFAQERMGSRTRYEGTGLGLSIVKKIVDQMDGTIDVESSPGVGSTFTLTLPFAICRDVPEPAPALPEAPALQTLNAARLLLAEDNDLNLEIACFFLEDAGARVDVALNGQEAVDLFRNAPPGTYNAILMDIMMPVMNGLDAARAIRRLDREDAGRIPIIAMTANAFSEDVQKCLEAGMNAHLAKPLEPAILLRVLGEYISTDTVSEG